MRRVKAVIRVKESHESNYKPIKLNDFSHFKEKINMIKQLKTIRRDLDEMEILQIVNEFGLENKKITPKRIKKIFKALIEKRSKRTNERYT